MSTGLTQYELSKMSKIKVFGTVILENIPQLIFQATYAYAINGVTDAAAVAFVASTLSATASTLSYLIQRDASDTKIVQYYLVTECVGRLNNGTEAPEEFTKIKSLSLSSMNGAVLSEEEKQSFLKKRGKRLCLAERIASVFAVPDRNLEVGHSMLTQYGIITHIVHYIYDSDLEALEDELGNDIGFPITPKFLISQLYESFSEEINQIFRLHFGLCDEFNVTFKHRLGVKNRTMSGHQSVRNDKATRWKSKCFASGGK